MTGRSNFIIDFVCTGNICRSPMGAVILRQKLDQAGLTDVTVASSGIENYHVGGRADERALAELTQAGYDGSAHRARQVDTDTFSADLIIAMATRHRRELIDRGADPARVVLLRDFDPAAGPDASVEDPYYGGPEGFTTTRQQIEAAAPGIVDWVRARIAG